MRVRDAALWAALLAVVVIQGLLFVRMSALEERLQAQRTSVESADHRFESVRRSVEKLASAVASSKAPSVGTALAKEAKGSEAGSAAPKEKESSPAEKAASRDEEDEESESADESNSKESEAAAGKAADPAPALARRKQLLEDIRSRLRQLDVNSDAQISVKEFDGPIEDFLYFDRNSSGRISLKEVEQAVSVEEAALDRVMASDKDRDGKVSQSEFDRSSRTFRYLDENDDGMVTVEEHVAEHRRLSERLERDDMDRDRKIAPAEFSGGQAKFTKYDKNKDGFIDRSELKEMLLHGH